MGDLDWLSKMRGREVPDSADLAPDAILAGMLGDPALAVGESVDDLQAFDAEDFARAIAGLDTKNAAAA
jgi:hypothetical protein